MATKKRITLPTPDKSTGVDTQFRSTLSLSDARNFRWDLADDPDTAHEAFTSWADHVRDRPSYIDRRKRNLLYASLYSNLPLLGFGANSYTRNIPHQGRISLNATQNAIDSLVSKACKNRPRPMFTTVEGDYELIEKAENADRYIDGRFYEMDYYTEIHSGRILDCAIYGLGCTKPIEVDGEGVIERCYPWELILDDRECMYGKPVRIGHRKYYDKQEAFDRWRREDDLEWTRDLEHTLNSQSVESDRSDFDRDETSEQVIVYEGYRAKTPTSPGKKIVCLRGKTLKFLDWNEKIPFNFMRPEVQTMGLWGIGMCERVAGIQGEINRIVRDIQMAMHLIAKPHWMVPASANVSAAMLNNDIATIIKYAGETAPTVYTPSSMSGEVFQHLQYLVKTLYEIMGVSQLSAQSQKPAGLSSAVALRTYLNVETERFNNFVRNAEDAAARDAMALAKVIGGLKTKKKVIARSGYTGRTTPQVTWEKTDFDTMACQVYPTSKTPDSPAGKREYALELAQYTQVTTDDVFELLEWTDTEAFAKERLAGKRNVRRDISKIRAGKKIVRDAIGNHQMAYSMMLDAYEDAKHDNLPKERLGVFREYIKACYRYMTGKAWVPGGPNLLPGQGGPPPGQPPGGPLPPGPMGQPAPMLPPGAPPAPPPPLANGGVPALPPQ